MAITPAIAGSAAAATPMSSQMADPMQQSSDAGNLTALVGQLRQLMQLADQIAQANPDIAQTIGQIPSICRQAMVQKAQTAPQQNPSAMALPVGSM